ncbi:hypothetical protein [Microtetraspora malaysiensis]|uniref:hypothetical protein n=1 Tax=Microtetraspora malaysiensis TaxID=161358 RepID=UPI003D8DFC48
MPSAAEGGGPAAFEENDTSYCYAVLWAHGTGAGRGSPTSGGLLLVNGAPHDGVPSALTG